MLTSEALYMARVLADKHGLASWNIVATHTEIESLDFIEGSDGTMTPRVVQVIARCFRLGKLIILSGPVVQRTSVVGVREIVLHEVAHALTDGDHNEAWQAMARRIGCTGNTQIQLEFYQEVA
jgi:hypothetical protein